MKIRLNGEIHEVGDATTVAELLALHDVEPRTVAVERNGEIVTKAEYAATRLAEGDAVEIVTFVGGG